MSDFMWSMPAKQFFFEQSNCRWSHQNAPETQLHAITINKCRYNQPSLALTKFQKCILVQFSHKKTRRNIFGTKTKGNVQRLTWYWMRSKLHCATENFWCHLFFYQFIVYNVLDIAVHLLNIDSLRWKKFINISVDFCAFLLFCSFCRVDDCRRFVAGKYSIFIQGVCV